MILFEKIGENLWDKDIQECVQGENNDGVLRIEQDIIDENASDTGNEEDVENHENVEDMTTTWLLLRIWQVECI